MLASLAPLATGSSAMTAIPLAPKPVILAIAGRLNQNNNHVLLLKSQPFDTRVKGGLGNSS